MGPEDQDPVESDYWNSDGISPEPSNYAVCMCGHTLIQHSGGDGECARCECLGFEPQDWH